MLESHLAGDDPASQVYVRNKARKSSEVGIEAETVRMPASSAAGDILAKVMEFNQDDAVDGILVQLPLPGHIDAQQTQHILNSIDPNKDVDGLHPVNLGPVALRPERIGSVYTHWMFASH